MRSEAKLEYLLRMSSIRLSRSSLAPGDLSLERLLYPAAFWLEGIRLILETATSHITGPPQWDEPELLDFALDVNSRSLLRI
jgi:hypothetical protein